MDKNNAKLPTKDYTIGEDVFYINNTLVSELDGSRIIGPLTRGELTIQQEKYKSIVSELPKEQKQKCPFIVYKLTRVE